MRSLYLSGDVSASLLAPRCLRTFGGEAPVKLSGPLGDGIPFRVARWLLRCGNLPWLHPRPELVLQVGDAAGLRVDCCVVFADQPASHRGITTQPASVISNYSGRGLRGRSVVELTIFAPGT